MSKVRLNLNKVKAIDNERRRQARAPKLAELDVLFIQALESNDNARRNEVVNLKQKLRDITADPKQIAAKSLDDVIAAWPEAELGPNPYTQPLDQ